jgi:tripartite-type tricarboxylate transporter receptor subunit TctC
MKRRTTLAGWGILAFLFLFAGLVTTVQAKNITILIGYPPGGGHDLEARVMGRHLSKYLPDNPKIIVQNLPGAGGMIMAAYTYNRAKPDGFTIGLFGSSHGLQALVAPAHMVKFDVTKMPIIWSVAGIQVHLTRDFLGARKADDLVNKVDRSKIVVAGRSKQGSSCLRGQLALRLLGIEKYTPVCAYGGTSPIRAAMERSEVSYFVASDAHLVGGGAFVDLHQRGLVFPMYQSGILKGDGTIARSDTVKGDVPTLYEVYKSVHGKEPSGPQWESWRAIGLGISNLTRTLVLPPGTPAARVAELRVAIGKMAKDPGFVKDWERVFGQKLAPVLVTPEDATKIRDDTMAPAEWQSYLRNFASAK